MCTLQLGAEVSISVLLGGKYIRNDCKYRKGV